MRVNNLLGSSPMSSANMQNTSRLRKCATACGSCLRAQCLREASEFLRRFLGDGCARDAGAQGFGIVEHGIENLPRCVVVELVDGEQDFALYRIGSASAYIFSGS